MYLIAVTNNGEFTMKVIQKLKADFYSYSTSGEC